MIEKISVCIPVKNPGDFFKPCLESIFQQEVPVNCEVEIVLLNSGDKLPMVNVPKNFEVNVYPVNPETFSHGGTRNIGVSKSTGEIIVFTVQDARLQGGGVFMDFVNGFKNEPRLVAISGYQSAEWKKSINPVKWFRPQSPGVLKLEGISKNESWDNLSYLEKRNKCSLDNVLCAYRREELIKHPFQITMYGEDISWGKSAVLRGDVLGFHGGIRAWHYHKETYSYIRNRLKCTEYIEQNLFGDSYIQLGFPKLRSFYLILFKSHGLSLFGRLYWIMNEILSYIWIQTLIIIKDHRKLPRSIKIGNQN